MNIHTESASKRPIGLVFVAQVLGGIAGVVLLLLAAEPLKLNGNPAVLQGCLIALTPIGATLGFYMSRKAQR